MGESIDAPKPQDKPQSKPGKKLIQQNFTSKHIKYLPQKYLTHSNLVI